MQRAGLPGPVVSLPVQVKRARSYVYAASNRPSSVHAPASVRWTRGAVDGSEQDGALRGEPIEGLLMVGGLFRGDPRLRWSGGDRIPVWI
jgi:hypothetical protein